MLTKKKVQKKRSRKTRELLDLEIEWCQQFLGLLRELIKEPYFHEKYGDAIDSRVGSFKDFLKTLKKSFEKMASYYSLVCYVPEIAEGYKKCGDRKSGLSQNEYFQEIFKSPSLAKDFSNIERVEILNCEGPVMTARKKVGEILGVCEKTLFNYEKNIREVPPSLLKVFSSEGLTLEEYSRKFFIMDLDKVATQKPWRRHQMTHCAGRFVCNYCNHISVVHIFRSDFSKCIGEVCPNCYSYDYTSVTCSITEVFENLID